jgi:hypothetical protein
MSPGNSSLNTWGLSPAVARACDLPQLVLQVAGGPRARVHREHSREEGRHGDEDHDRRHELVDAQPRAAHGDHLGVGGKASEGDEDGEQHRHRDGHLEERGHQVGHQEHDLHRRKSPADHELDQLEQPRDQQDEGEDAEPEEERRHNFLEYIAVEDLPHRGRRGHPASNE